MANTTSNPLVLAAACVQLIRVLPKPLMSHLLLKKVAPGFPLGLGGVHTCKDPNLAVKVVGKAIQDMLQQEDETGAYLELLVQVTWLLSNQASALTAQENLDRRQSLNQSADGLPVSPHAREEDAPSKASLIAAELAEPLAGACEEPMGSLSVALLTLFISHYDQILEGQVACVRDVDARSSCARVWCIHVHSAVSVAPALAWRFPATSVHV